MNDFTVYDVILLFPTEAAAIAALPWLRENDAWKPGIIVDLKLITAVGDENTPPTYVDGFAIDFMTTTPVYEELRALGVPYLIADRKAASENTLFIVETSFSKEQIAGIVGVSPMPAGAHYEFGPK